MDIRVGIDTHADKLGAKIRKAQVDKIPLMLVIGTREAETGSVSVRSRNEGDKGTMSIDDFIEFLKVELKK